MGDEWRHHVSYDSLGNRYRGIPCPEVLIDAAEQIALSNPADCEITWVLPGARAEGLLFLILLWRCDASYSAFKKFLGIIGILALLTPRAYVDYSTELAYTDANKYEWKSWVYGGTGLVGFVYVLLALDELPKHGVSLLGSRQVPNVDVEDVDIDAVIREHKIVFPVISTEGARSLMKHLCEVANLDVEDEYLKPHGARRGLGNELYRTNPTDAQATLRHSSIAITNKSYSHIEAGEISDVIDSMRNGEE